ncbi:MAG: alpha/beta fold hydrolase [Planctomycetota bacterium]
MPPLHVSRTGDGPAALFVHGFPLDHAMWAAQVEHLADVATCLAPDLSGFGASAYDGSEKLSMERHADDMARLLDEQDVERADVVALSMGGYVALAMWELHADRIRSLTLVDTRAEADDAAGRERRDGAIARLQEAGREEFARGMLPGLLGPHATDEVRRSVAAMIESTPYETIAAALRGMRDRADRTGVLASIDVPSLVLCGELDAITPPELSRAMAEALPRSELVLVPGAGHMAPMEAPDAVNGALRAFLTQRAR